MDGLRHPPAHAFLRLQRLGHEPPPFRGQHLDLVLVGGPLDRGPEHVGHRGQAVGRVVAEAVAGHRSRAQRAERVVDGPDRHGDAAQDLEVADLGRLVPGPIGAPVGHERGSVPLERLPGQHPRLFGHLPASISGGTPCAATRMNEPSGWSSSAPTPSAPRAEAACSQASLSRCFSGAPSSACRVSVATAACWASPRGTAVTSRTVPRTQVSRSCSNASPRTS